MPCWLSCRICIRVKRAYITANEFERITGADLNEFSTAGRRLIGDMAAQHGARYGWRTVASSLKKIGTSSQCSSEGLCQSSRIIKNERQIVYAWHRRLAIRPTKLCCSKWRKHGSVWPSKNWPRATRIRNRPLRWPDELPLWFDLTIYAADNRCGRTNDGFRRYRSGHPQPASKRKRPDSGGRLSRRSLCFRAEQCRLLV